MAKRRRRPGEWTEKQARLILEQWSRSGMTIQAYARKRGFTPERLYWWRRRLRESEANAPATLSLAPAVVTGANGASVVVRLGDEVALEIGEASPEWVASLIHELVERT